jgi:ectoine hydroxylase-related dioxygenase (phytanoyl-CoA dioxygenase family)
MPDWLDILAEEAPLSPSIATDLLGRGFAIVPGFVPAQRVDALSRAYDRAVTEAPSESVRVGSTTTRVQGLVGCLQEFDELFVHPLLLAACACILGEPFKLSSLLARTVHAGAAAQALHADVQRNDAAWPLASFIVMVDDFRADNGATRLVPESQSWSMAPSDVMNDLTGAHETEALACGSAGSVIVYNGSIWHGHTANRTERGRRSIQGAYVRRGAPVADHATRLRQEALGRLSPLAAYVLAV